MNAIPPTQGPTRSIAQWSPDPMRRPLMPRPLTGRVAIVTGSTRGIGAGIAAALAGVGCDLVLNGRTPPTEGAAIAESLADTHDVEGSYCPADLRCADQVEALAAFALDRFGRLDVLVNNAGVQHVAPVEAFPDERWDEVLALCCAAIRMVASGDQDEVCRGRPEGGRSPTVG